MAHCMMVRLMHGYIDSICNRKLTLTQIKERDGEGKVVARGGRACVVSGRHDVRCDRVTTVHGGSLGVGVRDQTVQGLGLDDAPVKEVSFEKATRDGFHRLFQYIQGANLNSSRVSMTAPVLTSIVPEAGPLHSSAYFVRFYLPIKFQATPPLPLPKLNLKPDTWTNHCVAVRKFSGFARDSNIAREAEKLAISLSNSPWANSTSSKSKYAYSIAQYNSPFRFIGRLYEVW
ncbi:hypothetical protein RJ639_019065, partial [Escallonia herrerae]